MPKSTAEKTSADLAWVDPDVLEAVTAKPSQAVRNLVMSRRLIGWSGGNYPIRDHLVRLKGDPWRLTKKILVWGSLIGLVAVFIYYNHEVEDEIKGFFEMMEPKWGKWCGPIMATLAITAVSWPPLFGAEIIIALAGMLWGLGIGSGVAILGTFLGEASLFGAVWFWEKRLFRFGRSCRTFVTRGKHRDEEIRVARREAQDDMDTEIPGIVFACLEVALVEGEWWLCAISRYGFIPTHVTVPLYGMAKNLAPWHFFVGLTLSMGRQVLNVYIGTLLANEEPDTSELEADLKSKRELQVADSSSSSQMSDALSPERLQLYAIIAFVVMSVVGGWVTWFYMTRTETKGKAYDKVWEKRQKKLVELVRHG